MLNQEEYAEEIARVAWESSQQLAKQLTQVGPKPQAWYAMPDMHKAGYRIIAVAVAKKIAALSLEGNHLPFKPAQPAQPPKAQKPQSPSTQAPAPSRAAGAPVGEGGSQLLVGLVQSVLSKMEGMERRVEAMEKRADVDLRSLGKQEVLEGTLEPKPNGQE